MLLVYTGTVCWRDGCKTCVAFEGFVLYAGGDYALHPNIMLLVKVMAYVMSGTFTADIVHI